MKKLKVILFILLVALQFTAVQKPDPGYDKVIVPGDRDALAPEKRSAATVASLNSGKTNPDSWHENLHTWKDNLEAAKTKHDPRRAGLPDQTRNTKQHIRLIEKIERLGRRPPPEPGKIEKIIGEGMGRN